MGIENVRQGVKKEIRDKGRQRQTSSKTEIGTGRARERGIQRRRQPEHVLYVWGIENKGQRVKEGRKRDKE